MSVTIRIPTDVDAAIQSAERATGASKTVLFVECVRMSLQDVVKKLDAERREGLEAFTESSVVLKETAPSYRAKKK